MSSKPTLYSYFRSSSSWRVRIALAIKEIEYEYKAIHLVKGEQLADNYKEINPQCLIPTLLIDGQKLTQSLSIIEYLDETRPNPPLLPKDALKRSQARTLALIIGADIQPVQNLRVLKAVGDDRKMEWGKNVIDNGFEAFEKALQSTAGKYCIGDEVTIPDLFLVPQVYNANRFKVDMSRFPTIARINDELSKLEPFQVSHPSQQPDCPEELR
ncbi:maleylacetoacetate isomerase-like isoform X1 [Rhopilema esculentum]|uniref:maleylacetoacetate isomerase-like isoform X1 n=1 Tax=Rhopilema esculentum TaxID=499914 RepID=UPI0031E23AE6